MSVGRQVQRHVVEEDGEIGPVIEIKAAHEILVRLPAAGMLGDDDAGHGFKNFAHAQNRTIRELTRPCGALRGRDSDAHSGYSERPITTVAAGEFAIDIRGVAAAPAEQLCWSAVSRGIR